MRLQVNVYYIGVKSNEQLIPPGIYEVGDPALHGAEDYLVNNQRKADYVPDEPAAVPQPPQDPPATEPPVEEAAVSPVVPVEPPVVVSSKPAPATRRGRGKQ